MRFPAVRDEDTGSFFIALDPDQFVLAIIEVAKSAVETQRQRYKRSHQTNYWQNHIRFLFVTYC